MIDLKKRLILILLIMSIYSAFCCASVYAETYIDEVKYREVFTVLSKLGFITYTNGDIPTEKMTRIEYVEAIMRLFGDSFSAETENVFTDVNPGSKEAEMVNLAYSMKLVSGYGTGFRPYDEITYADAVVIAVRAIGYGTLSDDIVYSGGYFSVAKDAGLLKNISNNNENFNKADAYMLIYNAMNANMVEYGVVGKEIRLIENKDTTLLSMYHNIYCIEGQVTKTRVTGLLSADSYKDGIEITGYNGDIVRAVCTDEYNDTIGLNVKAFYRNDGINKPEIVCIVTDNKNLDIIEIKSNELIDVNIDTREFIYEYANGTSSVKTKKKTVPVSASWIYNAQYVDNVKENVLQGLKNALNFSGDLNIENIQLIDLDSDNKIDLVKVNMYKNIVVDHVGTDGMTADIGSQNPHNAIAGEGFVERRSLLTSTAVADYNGNNNLFITDEKIYYIHAQDDSIVDITNLEKYTVLSVKEGLGDKPYVDICAVFDSVENTLKTKNDNLEIQNEDGNIYTVANAKNLNESYENLSLGENYVFLLDRCGRVAGWLSDKETSEKKTLGFVLRTYYDKSKKTTSVFIYIPDEESDGIKGIKEFYTAKNIKLDGNRVSTGDVSHIAGSLIEYKLNEAGEIKVIETPDGTPKDGKLQYFVKDAAIREVTRNNYLYFKFAVNIFVNQNYMAGSIALGKNTRIIRVPDNYSDSDQWKYCSQMRLEDFTRDTNYNDIAFVADGYVYNSKSVACDVIVIRRVENRILLKTLTAEQPMIIDKIKTSWSENDGEQVVELRGANTTGTKHYYSVSDKINIINGFNGMSYTYVPKPASAIHKGDAVLPYCDELGRLVAVLVLYSYSGETEFTDPTSLLTANGDRSSAVFVGQVERIDEPFMIFKEKTSQEEWLMSIRRESGASVVIYDTKTNVARPGSYLDLVSERGEIVIKAFNSRVVSQICMYI